MLITLSHAARLRGYASRTAFNRVLRERFKGTGKKIVMVGSFMFVDKADIRDIPKNPGKGRPVTTGSGIKRNRK